MHTILIVEDDKTVQMVYRELLSEEYSVILASSGEEALERVDEALPDLIILDIKLPGKHGLEVLEEIRRRSQTVPIIVCTAYPQMKNDYIIVTSNVAAYMVKPFDIEELRQKIKEILKE
jgi:DNA-binding response OmpR family regulator